MKWDGQKIKLSISILVSDTIDTIEKCMKSIQPILEEIPSELIVVDTGGTDGSIEIAKKYADKVVKFEWCKDFSKARNAGLELCTGEWFMFMDDDEWFEDVHEMIEFFKSNEYKNYRCASYVIRNYGDRQGSNWHDTRSIRMVRMEKDTKFVNAVHEMLTPSYFPEKVLDIFAHHYGYVYANEEERRKHGLRNITLVQKELAKNPGDYRMKVQLAQEYRAVYEFQMSEEFSLKELAKVGSYKNVSEHDAKMLGWLIDNVVALEIQKKDSETAYKYGEEFVVFPWLNTITRNNLYYYLTNLSFELKKNEECIKYAQKYEQSYMKLKDDLQLQRQEIVLEQGETLQEKCVAYIYTTAIRALLRLERIKEIDLYIEKLMKLSPLSRTADEVEDFLWYLLKTQKETRQFAEYLLKYEPTANMVCNAIDSEKWTETQRTDLIDIFAQLDIKAAEPYRIVGQFKGGDSEQVKSMLEAYLWKMENILSAFCDIWELMDYYKMDIGECIDKKSLKEWTGQVNRFAIDTTEKKVNIVLQVLRHVKHNTMKTNTLKLRCVEYEMRKESVKENDLEELKRMGKEYSQLVFSVYQNFYKEEAFFNDCAIFLPKECRFAIKLGELMEKGKNELDEASLIKDATEIFPEMANYCKAYVLKLKEQLSQSQKERQEFNELAKLIKQKVYELIAKEEYEAAKQVFKQLKQLIPNDLEMKEIEKML